MENTTITQECIRDLMAFHLERVVGYELMLSKLTVEEKHLDALFDAFIRQSTQMKEELRETGARYGADEGWLRRDDGRLGLAWSVVKTVFSSKMPNYSLDKCRSGENALLIAYHAVEGTDGLQPPVRLLINKQKRELIAARDWIAHFEGLIHQHQSPGQQLAVVS